MVIIFVSIFLLAVSGLTQGRRTLHPELLINFEQNLLADYRQHVAENGNVLSERVKRELSQRIRAFASNFDVGNNNTTDEPPRRRRRQTSSGNRVPVLDSSSFVLHGFDDTAGTIPINFPKDLCLFEANTKLYAAALHQPSEHITNQTYLTIFQNYGTMEAIDFREIYTYRQKSAEAMDCISLGSTAFIALAYLMHSEGGPIVVVSEGSPVFQVLPKPNSDETVVELVQYFTELHLNRVYFVKQAQNLFFMQSFCTDISKDDPNTNTNCLVYKWSGYHFDVLDQLPCTNSMQVEPFHIGSDMFVAIANYRDVLGQVDTFSYIYKYSVEHRKFVVLQRLRSHAAVDLKYFELIDSGRTERFIVVANSYMQQGGLGNGSETHSIIYKYSNDFFQPFQSILLVDVVQFLPVMGPNFEFLLMIVCKKQAAKLWQYNGVNFEETPVQFTGGALGKGVSHLRHYSLRNATSIVVANTNMLKEANNIFLPIYSVRQNAASILAADPSWCADALAECNAQAPDRLLDEILAQPKKTDATVTTSHALNFRHIAGRTLSTKSIKTKNITIDQSMVDRLNAAHEKLIQLTTRLDEFERKHPNVEPRIKLNSTLDDSHLGDSKITHIPLKSDYQSHEVKYFDELIVNQLNVERINNRSIAHIVTTDRPIEANTLKVDTIFVTSRSQYDKLTAATNNHDLLADADESQIEHIEYPDQVDEIVVDQLSVDGTINGVDLATIQKFALRVDHEQVQELTAQFNFGQLQANAVTIEEEVISNKRLSHLVRTVGGPYTVQQDVSFDQPLSVNKFIAYERINNIRIEDQQLGILQKRSPNVQTVTGSKKFASVKLRTPIVLHGKISNSNLDRMNPVVTMTKDIELEGDYVISGNVTIKRMLSCDDMFGAGGVHSAKYAMDEGLTVAESAVAVSMEFVQPIRTKELHVKQVNNVKVGHWAVVGGIQEITAKKTFVGDLHISKGFCDAISVNGINLMRLNETVLKKSGDQTIEGNIQFRKITVRQHSSKNELFASKRITDFLNRKDQIVTGNVTIRGNLLVRNSAHINNMNSAGRIDGFDVPGMIRDTLMVQSPVVQTIVADILFKGNVTFGRIDVVGDMFGLGTWSDIQQNLLAAQQDIWLEGSRKFGNSFKVGELVVRSTINGIPCAGFGKQWLLKDSDQNFTAPQFIAGLTSSQIWTQNRMNNVDLEEWFRTAVWLNETLTIGSATFETITSHAPIEVAGLVNGIKFPEEIIVRKSTERQDMAELRIAGDLRVNGRLDVGRTINGMDNNRMGDLLGTETSPFGLHILGSADFAFEPTASNLNGVNMAKLSASAWYLNEDSTLSGNIVFNRVSTSNKNIELKGYLNGKNVSYLNEHFVSLSRDEEIWANLTFTGNVMFKDVMEAHVFETPLDAIIRHSSRVDAMNINEFCTNVLRKDTDQEITGQWSFADVIVHGDLDALINGLDLRTDVLRYSVPMANVTSPKRFRNLVVDNLLSQNDGRVQDVVVAEWIARSALIVGNYTIQGTTIVENPKIFGDVKVFGRVNNLPFTPDTILTRSGDQEIRGNVRINNKHLADNKIQSLTINDAQLNTLNGIPVTSFLQNLVPLDRSELKTSAHLIFTEPLVVGSFHSSGQWNGVSLHGAVSKLGRHMADADNVDPLGMFHQLGVALKNDIKNRNRHLEALRYRQSVVGNIRQIVTMRYATSSNSPRRVYVTYSLAQKTGSLSIWKWDPTQSQLVIDDDQFALQPIHMDLVDLSVVTLFDKDYLIVETVQDGITKLTYFTFVMDHLRIVYEGFHNGTQNTVPIPLFGQRSCVGLFTEYVSSELQIECALFTPGGKLEMEAVGSVPASAPLVQVISYSDAQYSELIMLDVHGGIGVWRLSEDRDNPEYTQVQSIAPLHLSRTISTTRYRNSQWLATSSAFQHNSTHLGSVDVYRSIDGNYQHVQSILVDIPAQIEIGTVHASGELVLYVLTESRVRPFIVFRYTGVTLFREFFVASTLSMGRRFKLIGPTDDAVAGSTELIAVLGSEENMDIIESVLN